jgi:hypothetical protein
VVHRVWAEVDSHARLANRLAGFTTSHHGRYEETEMIVSPDWIRKGTALAIEQYIGNGFVFRGAGFYLRDNEFALITRLDPCERPWAKKFTDDEIFVYHSYSCALHESIFGHASGPVRQDDRT